MMKNIASTLNLFIAVVALLGNANAEAATIAPTQAPTTEAPTAMSTTDSPTYAWHQDPCRCQPHYIKFALDYDLTCSSELGEYTDCFMPEHGPWRTDNVAEYFRIYEFNDTGDVIKHTDLGYSYEYDAFYPDPLTRSMEIRVFADEEGSDSLIAFDFFESHTCDNSPKIKTGDSIGWVVFKEVRTQWRELYGEDDPQCYPGARRGLRGLRN